MKRKTYKTRLYNENRRKRQRDLGYTAISKGDKTEQYVFNIMKNFKDIEDVQVFGSMGCLFDIVYKYKNDEYRALQVKTLIKDHNSSDIWRTTFETDQYFPDTLIVLVNEERSRFGLISYDKVNVKTLSLGFSRMNRGKYRHNKYIEEIKFSESLNRRSKSSSLFNIEKSFSDNIKKEYDSLQRLKDRCIERSISFERNTTNSDVIDCFINSKKVQCKYTSIAKNYCKFNIYKSNGSIDGVHQIQPYNENDPIDYFVFEVGGTIEDPCKYKGQFCTIPMSIMIEKGYVTTNKVNGRTSISLCLPDYEGDHWCLEYWNSFKSSGIVV